MKIEGIATADGERGGFSRDAESERYAYNAVGPRVCQWPRQTLADYKMDPLTPADAAQRAHELNGPPEEDPEEARWVFTWAVRRLPGGKCVVDCFDWDGYLIGHWDATGPRALT